MMLWQLKACPGSWCQSWTPDSFTEVPSPDRWNRHQVRLFILTQKSTEGCKKTQVRRSSARITSTRGLSRFISPWFPYSWFQTVLLPCCLLKTGTKQTQTQHCSTHCCLVLKYLHQKLGWVRLLTKTFFFLIRHWGRFPRGMLPRNRRSRPPRSPERGSRDGPREFVQSGARTGAQS